MAGVGEAEAATGDAAGSGLQRSARTVPFALSSNALRVEVVDEVAARAGRTIVGNCTAPSARSAPLIAARASRHGRVAAGRRLGCATRVTSSTSGGDEEGSSSGDGRCITRVSSSVSDIVLKLSCMATDAGARDVPGRAPR